MNNGRVGLELKIHVLQERLRLLIEYDLQIAKKNTASSNVLNIRPSWPTLRPSIGREEYFHAEGEKK